jgi:hypothetical protein
VLTGIEGPALPVGTELVKAAVTGRVEITAPLVLVQTGAGITVLLGVRITMLLLAHSVGSFEVCRTASEWFSISLGRGIGNRLNMNTDFLFEPATNRSVSLENAVIKKKDG